MQFTIVTTGPIENSQVALLDLRTGQSRVLVAGGSNPRYAASGHFVYGVGGTLRAVAFDLDRLQVRGTPVPVVERVVMKPSGAANFSLAHDGSLVYLAGDAQADARTLVWVDRQGREAPIPAPSQGYVLPRLSPDGRRVALDVRDQEQDIRRRPPPTGRWRFMTGAQGEWVRLSQDARAFAPGRVVAP